MTRGLQLVGATASYRLPDGTPVPVVADFGLTVHRGESVALVGPSGSGKTTILNVLGLLKRLDAGTYTVDGVDVEAWTDRQRSAARSARFGFVYQEFHLDPSATVAENVDMAFTFARDRVARRDRRRRVATSLAALGIDDLRKRFPHQLSGGQRQRVAIARALVAEPDYLLADEPTGSVDRATGDVVADVLFARAADAGCGLVVVTHDLALAARADRTVALDTTAVGGTS